MEDRQVQAETGGNLRLESLQDRETYDSRNTGGGFSVYRANNKRLGKECGSY
ncbi:hemagglutinin repeat-containing protein [uncultured Acidaminococcus sp.]|uniref:hemagglutinin repeat-containing protein n=1 Tax=uncultured Acidaminococcus sp. TaxID=352152 RepID=UPI00338F8463